MHEQGIRFCHLHHGFIDAPIGKGFFARFVFRFVAHAGPHICRDQVCTFTGLMGVFEKPRAVSASNAHHGWVNFVATGRAQVNLEALQVGSLQPSIGHVVAITHPRDRFALNRAAMLNVGKDVRQNLAGMEFIGQAIDDGYA